jgi:Tol biopolymer transport system component
MSDYLSAVLDELVPELADENGDWGRVVADARGETSAMTANEWPLDPTSTSSEPRVRHRRAPRPWLTRRRLLVIGLSAVLAALLVTPALGIGGRLLSLIHSRPSPLDVQAPAWSRDGRTIVFVSWRDGNSEIYAMDADGGSPRNLTQDPAKDLRPAWSPDGHSIAFVRSRDRQSEIYVMNADGSGKRNLTRNRANDDYPTWSPDGRRIAFLRGHVRISWVSYLYVMNSDGSGLHRLTLRVPEGTPETTGPSKGGQVVWSPDGRTIHFGRYLVRTDGSGARRLPYVPLTAVWSPDGRRIAFARQSPTLRGPCCYSHRSDIYVMNADGSGTRRLTHNASQNAEPAWSPDGRRIAFVSRRDGNAEVYVMNADGGGLRNLTRHPAKDLHPSWSPDGRKIAFASNRDGRLESYVMNADGSGQRSLTR